MLLKSGADAEATVQALIDKRVINDVIAKGNDGTGVIVGCQVTAQGTPNMTVAVAAGWVSVNGGGFVAVSGGNVTIGANTSGNPRIDLVCVNSSGTKSVIQGTAAASPNTAWPDPSGKVVLAAIYVPNSAASITTIRITEVMVNPFSMPIGCISIHAKAFGCPIDGSSDATTAWSLAIAACPYGGRILAAPIMYSVTTVNLSSRPDIGIIGWGGHRDLTGSPTGTIFRPRTASNNIIYCEPATLSQFGPYIEGVVVNNIDGLSGINGFVFVGVNGWRLKRCGAKYITGNPLWAKYGSGSSDQAWQWVEDFWWYQCTGPFLIDQVLNFNATRLNADVTDGIAAIRFTNYAQSCFLTQVSIDGQNASGVAKGIGIYIDTGGAHNIHVSHYKIEACAEAWRVEQGQTVTGPGTNHCSATQGVNGGVDEGTPDGKGFNISSGVTYFIVDKTRNMNMPTVNGWIDPNHPSLNLFTPMEHTVLGATPSGADIRAWLITNGYHCQD